VAALSLAVLGNLVNRGTVAVAAGGQLTLPGTLSGSGVLRLQDRVFASLGGSVGAGQTLALAGAGAIVGAPSPGRVSPWRNGRKPGRSTPISTSVASSPGSNRTTRPTKMLPGGGESPRST